MPIKHATTVAVADDGASPVGSDEWNADHIESFAPGSFTVADGKYVVIADELILNGTEEATVLGTGVMVICG